MFYNIGGKVNRMNQKMDTIAKTIGDILWKVFPYEYLQRVFSYKICDKDIVNQILFECCKYAYDYYPGQANDFLGTHSLQYYLPKEEAMDENAERLIRQRTIKKINDWKRLRAEYMSEYIGDAAEALLPPSMQTAEEKFSGYKLTPVQYWEIEDFYETRIENAIVSRKIANKNYKYETFVEQIDEYDSKIVDMQESWLKSDKDVVINTLKAFLLEWNYNITFFYHVAIEMEKEKKKQLCNIERRKSLFCGPLQVISEVQEYDMRLGWDIISTDSRLLLVKNRFIQEFIADEFDIDAEFSYKEAVYLVANMLTNMTYKGQNIREWFKNNTKVEDWASVFREYNVFSVIQPHKNITRQQFRNMKYLLLNGLVDLDDINNS